MKLRFKNLCLALLACTCGTGNLEAQGHSNNVNSFMEEKLNLTQEWDKVFPQSDKVDHTKVTFHNRYGITLAADLYVPKHTGGRKLPAIAVSGPFGAVKEQASGLYAQELAERGFLTIAFMPLRRRLTSGRSHRKSSAHSTGVLSPRSAWATGWEGAASLPPKSGSMMTTPRPLEAA